MPSKLAPQSAQYSMIVREGAINSPIMSIICHKVCVWTYPVIYQINILRVQNDLRYFQILVSWLVQQVQIKCSESKLIKNILNLPMYIYY